VTKEGEKKWKRVGSPARPGTPDCPMVHRTVSDAPGWPTVNWLLSGKKSRRTAKIHRTIRWCTGLSGEPKALTANGRLRNPRVTRGPQQRSVGHTGLSGVHQTVSGAPTSPEEQQLDAPYMEGDRAPDMNSGYPVVHRTVRCTTRQKAGIAFQVGLQRLLAALGL
jgi:hypothetical protein